VLEEQEELKFEPSLLFPNNGTVKNVNVVWRLALNDEKK